MNIILIWTGQFLLALSYLSGIFLLVLFHCIRRKNIRTAFCYRKEICYPTVYQTRIQFIHEDSIFRLNRSAFLIRIYVLLLYNNYQIDGLCAEVYSRKCFSFIFAFLTILFIFYFYI